MKFLVDNYSSVYNTEPMYLSTTINAIDGCSCAIFQQNNNISVYDKFDSVRPDIYITHSMLIDNAIIAYIKENKDISILINISGIDQNQLSQIESLFNYHNIKSVLFFINYANHGLKSRSYNIFVLPHGADIYLGKNKNINYSIDSGIIISTKSQISKRNGTYHYISVNNSLNNDADIVMPTMYLSNIYSNYHKIIIKSFGKIIPQYFYDAVFYSNIVEYEDDGENDTSLELLRSVFKDIDSINLKEIIKNKHTCLNRTKSLLSQLPCNDIVLKLGKIMEGIKWA